MSGGIRDSERVRELADRLAGYAAGATIEPGALREIADALDDVANREDEGRGPKR